MTISGDQENGSRPIVFILTYSDPHSHNELLGVFRTLEEAKEGGNRHYSQFHVGAPRWETDGLGAKAEHDKAIYEITSFIP